MPDQEPERSESVDSPFERSARATKKLFAVSKEEITDDSETDDADDAQNRETP